MISTKVISINLFYWRKRIWSGSIYEVDPLQGTARKSWPPNQTAARNPTRERSTVATTSQKIWNPGALSGVPRPGWRHATGSDHNCWTCDMLCCCLRFAKLGQSSMRCLTVWELIWHTNWSDPVSVVPFLRGAGFLEWQGPGNHNNNNNNSG